MSPSLTDLATSSANDPNPSSGGRDVDDFEPFDVSDLPFVKQHPTTAFGGTAVALRYFPDQDDPSRGYGGLVLDAPFLGAEGGDPRVAIRDAAEGETGDHVKIVDLEDQATKAMPGEVGVDFDGNSYYAELFDEWPEESEFHDLLEDDDIDSSRAVLKLTGSGGRSAIRSLDVHGRGNFGAERDSNGDLVLNENGFPVLNDSLIETHPDWYDDDVEDAPRPRFGAGHTELRPDVAGSNVVVLLQRLSDIQEDYDGRAYWVTVFAELDDERRQALAEQYADRFNSGTDDDTEEKSPSDFLAEVEIAGNTVEVIQLQPTDEFERSEEIKYSNYSWAEWNYPDREQLNEARVEHGFDPLEDDD